MTKSRWVSLFSLAVLYLPLLALVVYSFAPYPVPNAGGAPSLLWYRQALTHPETIEALWNSLEVAALSTFLATVLGTAASLALRLPRFRGRAHFESLSVLNLVVPEIVFALALLVWFSFLRVTLGLQSIILAHGTFTISYVVLTVNTSLERVDPAWEEAARDLGATQLQAFRKVTLPLIAPGILAAALLAFTLSFDDFLISYFTAGVGADTLPMQIYAMIRFGISPELSALSTLILVGTAALVLLAQRLGKTY